MPQPDRARNAAVLSADRVSVVLDGATLLAPTSLGLAAGECVAVLGPNGAGKTTLLRVLSGRLRPSSGSASLRGEPLDERRSAVRRELAVLLEPPALYPDLTLAENLDFVAAAWSGERADGRAPGPGRGPGLGLGLGLGESALEVFGIEHLGSRFPDELSSGQRQLASLAVTFARPASVLLLDEPEQRLDPSHRALLGAAMLAAQARGIAVVFASHDAELVERVAQKRVTVGS